MRTVQIYINDQVLDLFSDENIEVTSSVQNINDIAKVFTDFSQQFTVPASPRNNEIFKHYYQNDVDNGFIARERQPARIEINFTPFRKGKIQLEGAELVDGQVQSYSITFYGDVVTLKDLFKDDKLRDLDYSDLTFEYTYTNVKNSITSATSQDVRFPLISSSRVWEYGDLSSEDIETSAGAINYAELKPAIRTAKIFDAIEDTYGVTLSGSFLSDPRFTKLYTWWKGGEATNLQNTIQKDIDFGLNEPKPLRNSVAYLEFQSLADIIAQDPTADLISVNFAWHSLTVYITAPVGEGYLLDVYQNGGLVNTLTGSGTQLFTISSGTQNTGGLNQQYTFKLRANNSAIIFGGTVTHQLFYNGTNSDNVGVTGSIVTQEQIEPFQSDNQIDFSFIAPDMLVSDFFTGVLRMFNLTCYPLDDALTYQVEPLEFWYSVGKEIDITEHTDIKKIKIDRPKLYKNIEFNWKESKAFLNAAYADANNRQYGILRNYFGYDGGDFKIDLPFETLLFNKFTGTDLQVSYSLEREPDYQPYIPAPVMLYLYDVQECSFFLTDGVTPEELTAYMPFGQEIYYNATDYSINFNEEISSLTLEPVTNSLYDTYYRAYLQNLFSDKTRIVTVETNLPLRLLNELELNDAIIIRDKKYRINQMRSQLTTGKVTLELITDLVIQPRTIPPLVPAVPNTGIVINVPIRPVKPSKGGYWSIVPRDTYTWVTADGLSKQTGDRVVEFTVDANATGSDRSAIFDIQFYNNNDQLEKTEVFVINQNGTEGFILLEDDSYLLQESFDKIRI